MDATAGHVGSRTASSITHHTTPDAVSYPTEGLRRFAAALRELGAHRDVDQLLQLAVDLAVELIDACDVADVMLVRDGRTTVPVATDPLPRRLAQAQEDAGDGPCLAALRGDAAVVVANDLLEDGRWPSFAATASELGVRSALAHRLFVHHDREDRLGALNLYSCQGAFDDAAVELGGVFAAACSTALLGAIREEGLQAALASRDVIGQAKGIIMARHRVTAEEAYDLLARQSQERNVKLVELARRVTETGAPPA